MDASKETILLVDGHEDDVLLFEDALRRSHLDNPVSVVQSGQEAMDYLSGSGPYADCLRYPLPAVIVLELALMPGDGFELLTWIRAQPHLKWILLVVLTNSIWPKELELARQLGADHVFSKPGGCEDLRTVVNLLRDQHSKGVSMDS